ncbi:MAG TPA: DUF481 domain-containing protein [Acidobacteriaceae bacterium]|nr:DUF481 domain-containing protein [Acidobacteriaceae bacterium]
MRSLRTIPALALTILFAATALAQKPAPQPDILIFTNGDQLTGHLERAAGGSVVFKSDMAGEVTISLDKVKEIRSAGSFSMLKKGPPSKTNLVGQGQISVAEGNVSVTPPAQPPVTLPVKDVGYLIDTPTYDREVHNEIKLTQGWTGAVTAGATFVRSTDNDTVFTAGLALARLIPTVTFLPPRQRMTLNVIETYGKATSAVIPQTVPPSPAAITKTSIFHADGEHDWYFTPHLYGLANLSFDHNFAQGLSLQQLYGGGIGWTPFETARHQLDLKADIHYERQNFFVASSNVDLIGTIFGEAYRRTLPRKIAFTQTAEYIPSWNHPTDYSALFTAGFVLPTWKRLGVTFNATDNYLHNPSPGYKANSLQFVAGVNYAFK